LKRIARLVMAESARMNASRRKQFPFFSTIDTLRASQPHPSGLDLLKYVLRGLFTLRAHNVWTAFLSRGIGGDQTRAQAQPHLLWKLQRPYLTSKAGLREKLAWLRAHHDWMDAKLPAPMVAQLYRRGTADLARHSNAAGDVEYLWSLAFDPQFAKEGELILKLVRHANGRHDRLVALAFTVYCERGRCIAHIGCLQGPSGPEGAHWIHQATKDFHGLRPMVAAVVGLAALCRQTGIDRVRAISQAEHIYGTRWRRRGRVKFDYDAFWAELGGQRAGAGWQLPMQLPRKDFAEIASQKRAQYRRRFALEDALAAQIGTALETRNDLAPVGIAIGTALSACARPASSPSLVR
jgi:uncharacterized protein